MAPVIRGTLPDGRHLEEQRGGNDAEKSGMKEEGGKILLSVIDPF